MGKSTARRIMGGIAGRRGIDIIEGHLVMEAMAANNPQASRREIDNRVIRYIDEMVRTHDLPRNYQRQLYTFYQEKCKDLAR